MPRAGGRVLSEASGVGSVHASYGPASSGGEKSGSDDARTHLIAGLRALRSEAKASSIHATFLQDRNADALASQGFLLRTDQQFHWFNEGYGSFDDFLRRLPPKAQDDPARTAEPLWPRGSRSSG